MEVLPAIIEDSYAEVEKKLIRVAPLVDWVQVDIGDGKFVEHRTWTQVEDLASLPSDLNIDLHIMVSNPLDYVVRAAKVSGIRRITFHYEATADVRAVIGEIKRRGRDAGIAINPETPLEAVSSLVQSVDVVLVMGVNPGWGGQGFLPDTPVRIGALKKMAQGTPFKVGVDGGIHLASGSAQAAVDAGADYLVVGSGIFQAPDPAAALRKFQQLRPRC